MARPGIQKHLDIACLLRCPHCGEPMHARQSDVACDQGHSYPVAAKGYLTLLDRVPALKGYDRAFFEARQRIFQAGHYRDLMDQVCLQVRRALGNVDGVGTVVDAGCGEGAYTKAVQAACHSLTIGLDLAKDGIQCAARGGGEERWIVADLASIPLADHAADVIVNVFTPANYAEFSRVLKPGGWLIKVVPAANHMRELRELVQERLARKTFDDHGVAEHMEQSFGLAERIRVTQTTPVAPLEATDLIKMSPVAFNMDEDSLDASALGSITVDAEILIART